MSSDQKVERVEVAYEPGFEKFVLREKSFTQQFSHVYSKRTSLMRGMLSEVARRQWGPDIPIVSQLIDTESDETRQESILIGIIYKEMELKPSVLDEFKDANGIAITVAPVATNFCSESDVLVVEDESGRMLLTGMAAVTGTLVTGVVLALKGHILESGEFEVSDWATALSAIDPGAPAPQSASGEDAYVMLVSGLAFGETAPAPEAANEPLGGAAFSTELLGEFLGGRLGGPDDVKLASQITRVIVAGNSIGRPDLCLGEEGTVATAPEKKTTASLKAAAQLKQQNEVVGPLSELDAFLCSCLSSCPVDLMPGARDPSPRAMPQQPLNECLLPHSSKFNTLGLTTNPYAARLADNVEILGHSGQPVDDLLAMEVVQDGPSHSLDALQMTLQWGHICPTAPDSLASYPFTDEDPFIITKAPSIYFAGNQDRFEASVQEFPSGHKTTVICVPDFRKTRDVVLVNLRSLECRVMNFGIQG
ncbi:unnamed protein product [Ectocarpus fasciculatus]